MRYRDKFMFFGSGAVLVALFASDPDFGILQELPFAGSTIASLLIFSKALLGLTFAHYGRKMLFDYPEGDFQKAAAKALEHPIGAGVLTLSYAVVFHGLLNLFKAG